MILETIVALAAARKLNGYRRWWAFWKLDEE